MTQPPVESPDDGGPTAPQPDPWSTGARPAAARADAAPPSGGRTRRHPIAWLLLALTALAVTTLAVPGSFGLSGTWPVAQLISFRSLLAVVLAVLAALLVVIAVASRRSRRWRILAFALVFALGGAGQWVMVTDRLTVNTQTAATPETLRLVSFNTQGRDDPDAIAQLIAGSGARIAALPETSAATAEQVATLLSGDGLDMELFHAGGHVAPSTTSLLVDRTLGSYAVAERGATKWGSLVVTRRGPGDGPVAIGAVHTAAPLSPGSMARWRTDTDWAVGTCARYPGMILAGDFNATIDHPAFNRLGICEDAAVAAGQDANGTWPSSLPPLFASPVDHVLIDSRAWWVTSLTLDADVADSDHRPLVAELTSRMAS